MTLAVAVDFGTSSTCVAITLDDEQPRVVVIDGSPLMPSAVYADGRTLFVGAEAQRQAALDPSRYEPTPKRRIDEGSLLLGDTVVPVRRVITAVLERAVREARNLVGGKAVDMLVLTHPAEWGTVRIGLLRSAAQGLAASVRTVAEPVAAAVLYGAGSADGMVLAVLDVGAGTTDVSVLRRERSEFRVLATRGDPHFGGADIDEALMGELGARLGPEERPAWDFVAGGQGLQERRRRRALRADVRGAKESLSRHSYADVPLPGSLPDGHVTRADLERLIAQRLVSVVEMLAATLREAGALDAAGGCRAGVFLVGGSSRIPLIATTVYQRLGVLPLSTEQPETVVARGALRLLGRQRPQIPATADPPRPQPVPPAPSVAPSTVRGHRRWWLAAAVALVVAIAAVGGLWASRGQAAPTTRLVVLQRISVTVPASWQEARRVEESTNAQVGLTPDGAPVRDRGLLVVQTILDPALTQEDVARALRAQVATEQAAGKKYEAFDGAAAFAGRSVIHYREIPTSGGEVDWYVLVQMHTQVSIGCQHPDGRPEAMAAPCEQAVQTVRVAAG